MKNYISRKEDSRHLLVSKQHRAYFLFIIFVLMGQIGFTQNQLNPNSKGTISLGYGLNLVFEDGNQFQNYFQNEKMKWNLSPFLFSTEYRTGERYGIQFLLSSNLYPEKQRYFGALQEKPLDVTSIMLNLKVNILPILKDTGTFDPYLLIGPGVLFRGNSGSFITNLGAGFNYWIGNRMGFHFFVIYSDKLPFIPYKENNYILSANTGLHFIIN